MKTRKFLALLLCFCMMLSLCVVSAGAETTTDNEAAIGELNHGTLDAAITAAKNGDTVKLLKDVTADVTISSEEVIILDLNGYKLTNVTSNTITNNGSLTIVDSSSGKTGTVDNITHGKAALYNNGTAYLNGGLFIRSLENGQNASNAGGNSFYAILNHGTMTITDGVTVKQSGHFSSLLENGWQNGNNNTSKSNSVLTITGGIFDGGLNTIKNDDYGKLTISGGTFKNVTQAAFLNWNIAEISGGTFISESRVILNGYLNGNMDQGKLSVTGGNFSGSSTIEQMSGSINIGTVTVSGGYFTADPSAYLASGRVALASDKTGYAFMVGTAPENVAVKAGETTTNQVQAPEDKPAMDETVKADLNTAASHVTPAASDTGLVTTAGKVVQTVTEEAKTDAKAALESAIGSTTQPVTVVIQPKLDVTPIYYDTAASELTLDIKATYDTIATTDPSNIKLDGTGKNAVKVGEAKALDVQKGTPVVITTKIPASMAQEIGTTGTYAPLTIKHIKENGDIFYYTAQVTQKSGSYYATFTVTNGFSQFTLMQANTTTLTVNYDSSVTAGTYGITDVGSALPTTAKTGYMFLGWKFEGVDGTFSTLSNDLWTALTKNGNATVTAVAQYAMLATDVTIDNTSPMVGDTLTAVDAPSGAAVSYQWLCDGTAIAGATAKTYTVTGLNVGCAISLSIKDGAGNEKTSAATAKVLPMCIKGAEQSFTAGKAPEDGLSFEFNGDISRLSDKALTITKADGTDVTPAMSNDGSAAGNTALLLTADYLNSLGTGDYTVHVNYKGDVSVQVSFTVKPAASIAPTEPTTPVTPVTPTTPTEPGATVAAPNTGDTTPMGLIAVLLCVSVLGTGIVCVMTHKRGKRCR